MPSVGAYKIDVLPSYRSVPLAVRCGIRGAKLGLSVRYVVVGDRKIAILIERSERARAEQHAVRPDGHGIRVARSSSRNREQRNSVRAWVHRQKTAGGV